MKTNVIEITYGEWIKNPFPMPKGGLRINEVTQYRILDCPIEYATSLRTAGLEVVVAKPKMAKVKFTAEIKSNKPGKKTKKQTFTRQETCDLIDYYCGLQRLACSMPLASLIDKIPKEDLDKLSDFISNETNIFKIRNPEDEI